MSRAVFVLLGLLIGLAFAAGPANAHATAAPATATEHDHAKAHEHATHHSHGIGEDTYHQKASHCSLDFPFEGKTPPFARASTALVKIATKDEARHGLVLAPPVPPPLA